MICLDCNSHIEPDFRYRVKDELWPLASDVNADLCVPCLVKRLGRKLELEDFTQPPLNFWIIGTLP